LRRFNSVFENLSSLYYLRAKSNTMYYIIYNIISLSLSHSLYYNCLSVADHRHLQYSNVPTALPLRYGLSNSDSLHKYWFLTIHADYLQGIIWYYVIIIMSLNYKSNVLAQTPAKFWQSVYPVSGNLVEIRCPLFRAKLHTNVVYIIHTVDYCKFSLFLPFYR